MRTVLVRTLAALALLLLAGCGGSGHNQADVDFAEAMIPHHRQAVAMSDLLLAKPDAPGDVRALATRIKGEQDPEIQQMSSWLVAWGEAVPAEGSGGMGGMSGDGMMSQEEMDQLAAADGVQARRLFLEGMVRHHQGAVTMAQAEVEGGRDDDAQELARSIVTSQQAEIDEMNRLLGG